MYFKNLKIMTSMDINLKLKYGSLHFLISLFKHKQVNSSYISIMEEVFTKLYKKKYIQFDDSLSV